MSDRRCCRDRCGCVPGRPAQREETGARQGDDGNTVRLVAAEDDEIVGGFANDEGDVAESCVRSAGEHGDSARNGRRERGAVCEIRAGEQ